ncbi:hypothetical protein AVEN_244797-1, partial [Araneus ventricosus]
MPLNQQCLQENEPIPPTQEYQDNRMISEELPETFNIQPCTRKLSDPGRSVYILTTWNKQGIQQSRTFNGGNSVPSHEIIQRQIWKSILTKQRTWSAFPGHVGIPENELADQEAKLAITSGEKFVIPAPYSHLKGLLKNYIVNKWNEYWNSYDSTSGITVRGYINQ